MFMRDIFTKERITQLDIYFSLFNLVLFLTLFGRMVWLISDNKDWQRYEIHILQNSTSVICDVCKKAEYATYVKNIFKRFNPESQCSVLYPVWPNGKSRLITFSVFSQKEIKILAIYNELVKHQKCKGELIKMDLNNLKIEEWSLENGSKGECKISFIYERKL